MANPQIENGYTKIANELLQVIYGTNFNATQLKIILCIIRYTYGFNRKSHAVSLSFLSNATGISKRYISSELQKLISSKVILVIKSYTVVNSRELGLNKKYSQWVGYRTIIHQMNDNSPDEEQFTTTDEQYFTTTDEELFYQERNIKESIKESSTHIDFFENIWSLYPNKKGKGRVSESKKKEIYKLGDEIERCISRYVNDVKKRRSDGFKDLEYQNGSTFFNSGYIDYLDSNYLEKEKVKDIPPLKFVIRDEI